MIRGGRWGNGNGVEGMGRFGDTILSRFQYFWVSLRPEKVVHILDGGTFQGSAIFGM